MTVVDVNTGKFTGSGGNLEETVTKNNLEAAEEIVRQLRLRDIGGIIVVDFIDMVLESNRDLVLRRLVECLGRDRTRHQVAEVTSLGLVQMTRKRIGTGLLEAFSENCEHCQGRGVRDPGRTRSSREQADDDGQRGGRRGRSRGSGRSGGGTAATGGTGKAAPPSPKDVAAMARDARRQAAGRRGRPRQPSRSSRTRRPEPGPGHSEAGRHPASRSRARRLEEPELTLAETHGRPRRARTGTRRGGRAREPEPAPSRPAGRAGPARPSRVGHRPPGAGRAARRAARRSARRGPRAAAQTRESPGRTATPTPAARRRQSTDGRTAGRGATPRAASSVHVPIKRKGSRKR